MKSAAVFAALFACLFLPVSAQAADKLNIIGATRAIVGGDFTASGGVAGVQADANTTNFYVEGPSGTAGRYVDVFNKSIFIPLKTDAEANAFAQNVDVGQARVDLVRPKYVLGTTDFTGGLSMVSASMPVNMRGTPTSATSAVVGDIPRQRIDTSGAGGMQVFINSNVVTRTMGVNMKRSDCRVINYPDGTSENICAPLTTWVENPVKRWIYHLTARGVSDADNAQVMMNKLTTPTPLAKQANLDLNALGNWTTDFIAASAPPAYVPPAPRSCGTYSNGQFWWADVSTGTSALPCPVGQIYNATDPYRQTWTNQQQYQCYDGRTQNGAYPLAPTRIKPDSTQTVGSCLAIVNGQCNATYTSQGWFSLSNSSALCSAGTTTNFAATSGGWTWSCAGQNTGSTVNCSAAQAVNAQVGSANGGLFNSAPTTGLCNVGTPSGISGTGGIGSPWTWTCSGVNGGNAATGSANMIFHWVMDGWSACTSNQQTRGVYCYDANNQWLPHTSYPDLDNTCIAHGAGAKPPYQQSCVSDTYHWEVDAWGGFSACDAGSQHRERGVYCRNQNGVNAPNNDWTPCNSLPYPGWQQFQSCSSCNSDETQVGNMCQKRFQGRLNCNRVADGIGQACFAYVGEVGTISGGYANINESTKHAGDIFCAIRGYQDSTGHYDAVTYSGAVPYSPETIPGRYPQFDLGGATCERAITAPLTPAHNEVTTATCAPHRVRGNVYETLCDSTTIFYSNGNP